MGYWNYKHCSDEAKKYTKLNDFRNNSNCAYCVALKNKWLDDYTWLEREKKPGGYWTQEHCYEEAKKYQTLNEFYKNSSSAYKVAKKNNWLSDYDWF